MSSIFGIFSFAAGFFSGFLISLISIVLGLIYLFFDLTGVKLLFQTKLIRILIFFARIFDKFFGNSSGDLVSVINQHLEKLQQSHQALLLKYKLNQRKRFRIINDYDDEDEDEEEKNEQGASSVSSSSAAASVNGARKLRRRRMTEPAILPSISTESTASSSTTTASKETFVWLNTFLQHAFREFVLKNNERLKQAISLRIAQMASQSNLHFLVRTKKKKKRKKKILKNKTKPPTKTPTHAGRH